MFVNNEITDRGLLHKVLRKTAAEVTMDERMLWARSVEGAIKDATRPSAPFRLRLTRPAVVLAAAPALSAVAAALRNEDIEITRETLDAVREFMTDGVDSPLYGSDPLAADRGADDLRRLFVATETAQRTHGAVRQTTAV